MKDAQFITDEPMGTHQLDRRLEEAGWALFLIMIGGLWLVPTESVPKDLWLVGAGLIMLGINFLRYFNGIKMSGFTVFLGILALVAGLGGAFSLNLPFMAVIFVILGTSLLMRALFRR
jgi:hypothetical protein